MSHLLINWLLVLSLDWYDPSVREDINSKLVDGVNVFDVDDRERVGNSFVENSMLKGVRDI